MVLIIEKFAIGAHVFEAVKAENGSWLASLLFEYGKGFSRTLVLSGVIFLVLIQKEIVSYLNLYKDYYREGLFFVLIPQILLFILFYVSTYWAFDAQQKFGVYQLLWLVTGLALIPVTALTIATGGFWRRFFLEQKYHLLASFAIGVLVWLVSSRVQGLWSQFSDITFLLVGKLLALSGANVYIDYGQKVIGIDQFLVNVDTQCSGYEGIGLVCAFISVFLYSFRNDFKFPISFLLYPIGALVVWLFNILRIVVLICIGRYWSEDVAIWGFHTQAGWIAFILTSVGIMWLAHSSRLFSRNVSTNRKSIVEEINLPIATLLPLVALLAMTFLTTALSGKFDWLYPLRVVVVAVVIMVVYKHLNLHTFKLNPISLWSGALVAVVWVLLVENDLQAESEFQSTITEAEFGVMLVWMLFRVVGTVITVPIAEELAFRGYLLCRLSSEPVKLQGKVHFSIVGFVLSSLAFGILHGAWLAGTIAGLVYAIVRYKSVHISDAIVAHGLTNLLLVIYVLFTGHWSLL